MAINYRFVVKRDTAANFTAANTLLLSGEFGIETDTRKMKMGDGVTVWAALPYRTTDVTPEGATNLYFTAARVLASVLAGLSTAAATVITATDTVLSALGKLQAQVSSNLAAIGLKSDKATTISTTAPITGGGDLSANRTLAITAASGAAAGSMAAADFTKLAGVAAGATANSTDAYLLARANHTGAQSADTLTDGATNKAFLATERTKLTGIATGATANATDAALRDRATHTGTQGAATITGLATVATSGLKADVGLGNADNTSDVNKPVSTAQQTALNLKANLANPTFTASVSYSGAPSTTYHADVSGAAISVANSGTVNFSNMSGHLVINNHTNANLSIWLCSSGITSMVGAIGTANGTLTYNVGINGYTWTNNTGAAATVAFHVLRTRVGA